MGTCIAKVITDCLSTRLLNNITFFCCVRSLFPKRFWSIAMIDNALWCEFSVSKSVLRLSLSASDNNRLKSVNYWFSDQSNRHPLSRSGCLLQIIPSLTLRFHHYVQRLPSFVKPHYPLNSRLDFCVVILQKVLNHWCLLYMLKIKHLNTNI